MRRCLIDTMAGNQRKLVAQASWQPRSDFDNQSSRVGALFHAVLDYVSPRKWREAVRAELNFPFVCVKALEVCSAVSFLPCSLGGTLTPGNQTTARRIEQEMKHLPLSERVLPASELAMMMGPGAGDEDVALLTTYLERQSIVQRAQSKAGPVSTGIDAHFPRVPSDGFWGSVQLVLFRPEGPSAVGKDVALACYNVKAELMRLKAEQASLMAEKER